MANSICLMFLQLVFNRLYNEMIDSFSPNGFNTFNFKRFDFKRAINAAVTFVLSNVSISLSINVFPSLSRLKIPLPKYF